MPDASNSFAPIPVVLCIDIEPDPRLVSRSSPEPFTGYERAHAFFAELRPRLAAHTGAPARFTWFTRMDPQVADAYGSASIIVERYGANIDSVLAHGDEIGLHTHAYRWVDAAQTWLHDFGNQEWVEHALRSSVEAYRRALGRPCLSHRFGAQWMNTESVNLAEQLGVRFDLSVEPGLKDAPIWPPDEPSTGRIPDLRRVPRAPYTPAPDDFRRPQQRPRGIRLVPLTSSHVHAGYRLRGAIKRRLGNGNHWRQNEPMALARSWSSPDTFDRVIDRALAAQTRPYLALAVRSDFPTTRSSADAVRRSLEALLHHRLAERFVFCTAAEAPAILDATP